ncbi:MAG: LuxR family transcriptional regulator [Myxococcaceae bacterium]|nr:LuxR family transcriptional regulator [Myxococcaceae bacterium]
MKLPAKAVRRLVKRVGKKRQSVPHGELVRFAREVAGSRMTVDFEAAREIGLPVVVLRPAVPEVLMRLTQREREVARWVAEGLRNDQIAAQLGISLGTVKDHVHHALRKTGMGSRAELAAAIARAAL